MQKKQKHDLLHNTSMCQKSRVLYLMWLLAFYIPLLQHNRSFLGAAAASFVLSFFFLMARTHVRTHTHTHTHGPQTPVPHHPASLVCLLAWTTKIIKEMCGCLVVCRTTGYFLQTASYLKNTSSFLSDFPMHIYIYIYIIIS